MSESRFNDLMHQICTVGRDSSSEAASMVVEQQWSTAEWAGLYCPQLLFSICRY